MMPVRLLLVDDEKGFVEALARRLKARGYSVTCAFSGESAMKYLDTEKNMDVVLLDVKMPGMDGLETLGRIKANHPVVETIMLTAHATVSTAVEAMKTGALDYVMKPCDLSLLVDKIEAAALRKRERESRILDVRMQPYITDCEKKALIAAILAA